MGEEPKMQSCFVILLSHTFIKSLSKYGMLLGGKCVWWKNAIIAPATTSNIDTLKQVICAVWKDQRKFLHKNAQTRLWHLPGYQKMITVKDTNHNAWPQKRLGCVRDVTKFAEVYGWLTKVGFYPPYCACFHVLQHIWLDERFWWTWRLEKFWEKNRTSVLKRAYDDDVTLDQGIIKER